MFDHKIHESKTLLVSGNEQCIQASATFYAQGSSFVYM